MPLPRDNNGDEAIQDLDEAIQDLDEAIQDLDGICTFTSVFEVSSGGKQWFLHGF